MRAVASSAPPGANATTMVTGRSGNFCAEAPLAITSTKKNRRRKRTHPSRDYPNGTPHGTPLGLVIIVLVRGQQKTAQGHRLSAFPELCARQSQRVRRHVLNDEVG